MEEPAIRVFSPPYCPNTLLSLRNYALRRRVYLAVHFLKDASAPVLTSAVLLHEESPKAAKPLNAGTAAASGRAARLPPAAWTNPEEQNCKLQFSKQPSKDRMLSALPKCLEHAIKPLAHLQRGVI